MSHAIPPHVFQTLKSHRWNCNVFGRCRKFGYPNCMRVLVDEAPKVNSCVRSSSHDTVHDPRDASTTTPTPHNAKSRFCTIRSPLSACRRRVAPLMLQFPRVLSGHEGASHPNSRPWRRPPAHRSHLHPQAQWGGFAPLEASLSACRRRVAPLMLQFPPFGGARSGRRGDRRRTRRRRRRCINVVDMVSRPPTRAGYPHVHSLMHETCPDIMRRKAGQIARPTPPFMRASLVSGVRREVHADVAKPSRRAARPAGGHRLGTACRTARPRDRGCGCHPGATPSSRRRSSRPPERRDRHVDAHHAGLDVDARSGGPRRRQMVKIAAPLPNARGVDDARWPPRRCRRARSTRTGPKTSSQ